MRGEDKLPVLAFPPPDRTDTATDTAPDRTPRPTFHPPAREETRADGQADAETFARALAALRSALEAEVARPRATPSARPRPPAEESFSPVGIPRPAWRAGPGASGDAPGRMGRTTGATDTDSPTGPKTPAERRILALYLPNFAMERWLRHLDRSHEAPPDDLPIALSLEGTHGPVIHAVNRAAAEAGVQRGARVVDMRALVPELRVDFADPGGDARALARLMLWARRWCPWTAVEGHAGLMMDTTGSAHLWGGEAAMLREIEARLSTLGLSARLAIAPTQGAAWALSRFGGVRETVPAAALAARIAPLPVRALRIDGDTVQVLTRLGLKTVGDLLAVPRVSLARRFSRAEIAKNPLLRLDQMTGKLAEPVNAPDDPPRFAVQAQLAEPVIDPTAHLPALAEELCAGLAAEGFGLRRAVVTVYRTDGEVSSVAVALSAAMRDPRHLVRLFEGRLERIDPGMGFDLITLEAAVAEAIEEAAPRLDGSAGSGEALARLTDRFAARFGPGALTRPTPRASHIPERAEAWVPAMATGVRAPPPPPREAPPARPLRLFEPPEEVRVIYAVPEGPPAQFIWRRVTHRVTRFAGPERIAPEWWADRPGTRLRDYYRIEDHTGRRFWLYREGLEGDGRGAAPRWFLHGVFG